MRYKERPIKVMGDWLTEIEVVFQDGKWHAVCHYSHLDTEKYKLTSKRLNALPDDASPSQIMEAMS